jgi:asparagine synthetase B (glutamine-hydrolysing)
MAADVIVSAMQLQDATTMVIAALRTAVSRRCQNTAARLHSPTPPSAADPGKGTAITVALPAARVAILFSGGVDSTLLAALAHESLAEDDSPIDLINICFDDGKSPDRLAAIDALQVSNKFPSTHCIRGGYRIDRREQVGPVVRSAPVS